MSYGTTAKMLGVEVEITSSSPEHELSIIVEADGTQYKYVQADSAVAQYDAVKIDPSAAGSGHSSQSRSTDSSLPLHLLSRSCSASRCGSGWASQLTGSTVPRPG